jgi:hypothetical protein
VGSLLAANDGCELGENDMKRTIQIIVALVMTVTGCGCTGLEIGARAGLYRVDERYESQKTNVNNRVPLKCYFVDCTPQAKTTEEVMGS